MNIKTIIFGCIATGVITGGILINNSQTTEAHYTPRLSEKVLDKGSAQYIEYIRSLKANQITGDIDAEEYNKVKQEVLSISRKQNKSALGLTWTNQGPDNVGGRTRAVLVDRNNPNIVYAGSVAGGLYVSSDGAGTWRPVGEMADNLAISCITQTASGRIFFGTGSTFDEAGGQIGFTPGFIGNGVYEYKPATEQIESVLVNSGSIPNNDPGQTLSYINAIASYGDRLYIGTTVGLRLADPDAGGIYPSLISGWTNPIHSLPGSPNLYEATVMDIDVASNGSMIVCFNGRVYHSFSDADDSFTRTFITGSRISAAIAPSDPNYIHLVATTGTLKNLYLSNSFDGSNAPEFAITVNGGVPSTDPFRQNDGGPIGQGTWDQCIAVDPNNPGRCLVGGVQLFEYNSVNPTPGPGDWVKITHLSEAVGPPYYMHADKHIIIWNGNTIYMGHDGGISKSIDNGETWSTKNLGFNTTTFFTVATNSKGYILGGAQDNGNQLVSFGDFGGPSPLSALEILGGDGFESEFSNLDPGAAFATAQNGVLTRSTINDQGFGTSLLTGDIAIQSAIFRTSIGYWESVNDSLTKDSVKLYFDLSGTIINTGDTVFAGDTIYVGDTIRYYSNTNDIIIRHIVKSNIITTAPYDSIILPDYVQHKMSYASLDSNAIYLTRDAANLDASSINWHRIADQTSIPNGFSGAAYVMEFTPDGNTLFAGSNGNLYRIDNLSMANDTLLDVRYQNHVTTCTRIGNFSGRNITGLAIDPNNADNVIVTLGNYSNTNYIYRSTTATTATTTTGFTSIQGPLSAASTGYLPRMPIYDAEIDITNNNTVLIGTEWGVWASENAFTGLASAVQWNEENTNLGHVPVFQIRQQTNYGLPTTGMMYLGTHGKGFWTSSNLITSIDNLDDLNNEVNDFVSDLTIYPNPLNTVGTISFNLKENAKTVAKIYNLNGALVKTIDLGMLNKGDHNQVFNASNLSIGSYVISVESGIGRSVSKFIVTR